MFVRAHGLGCFDYMPYFIFEMFGHHMLTAVWVSFILGVMYIGREKIVCRDMKILIIDLSDYYERRNGRINLKKVKDTKYSG